MIQFGYRIYDGLDGKTHFDQIVGGRVYPLKPEESDEDRQRGFYAPDFTYLGENPDDIEQPEPEPDDDSEPPDELPEDVTEPGELDDLPEELDDLDDEDDEAEDALAQDAVLAFDRSMRSYDENGHLHVAMAPISKAVVNEYYGHEIPDAEELGLDPRRRYRLYRDPEELAKGANTFSGKPILLKHQPVSADAHPRDLTIGTIGSGVEFKHPYLLGPLTVWDRDAIDGIETDKRKQLSAAYRYRADMTPGVVNGEKFDGVMRDIRGNHVALVPEGRAGADVVVGDAKPKESPTMPAAKTAPRMSRQALFVSAACAAHVLPKLATDQKVPDIRKLLAGVTSKTWKEKRPGFEAAFVKAVTPRLAQDASMEDFHKFLDGFSGGAEGEMGVPGAEELSDVPPEMKPRGEDDEPYAGEETPGEELLEQSSPAGKLMQFLQSVLTPEELAQAKQIATGEGEPPPTEPPAESPPDEEGQDQGNPEIDDMQRRREEGEQKKPPVVTKPAMDAAIADAVKAERARALAVREAEQVVRPYIGALAIAQDTAEDVYATALKQLGVKVEGVHSSAFRTILEMQPRPSERRERPVSPVAMDAAQSKDFGERFPQFNRLKRA